MYCSKLTRKDLEEMGIVDVKWENNNWTITRYWYRHGKDLTKQYTTLHPAMMVKEHKYGKTKYYYKVQFNYKGKGTGISLGRFLWAWFHNEVPEGYVIDHIDEDTHNNRLDNLQIMTLEENLYKRWDNPDNACNQWEFMDDFERGIDKYRRFCKRQRKKMKCLDEYE